MNKYIITSKHRGRFAEGGRKGGLKSKGRKLSDETKLKMSIAHKGKEKSFEHRRKLSESHKGNRSHLWKGGISPFRESIRKCYLYRQWRSDVFTRDNFTCQFCGKRGVELHADHIKKYSIILTENNIITLEEAMKCEELWNINNGRTLCIPCHKKTDTFGGKK